MTPHGREIRDEIKKLLPEWHESSTPLCDLIAAHCIRIRNLAWMDAQPEAMKEYVNREARRSFWNGVVFATTALLIIALGLYIARR